MALKEMQDQIKDLEKEISETKYNKRTQGAIGLLKAKLSKLKEKQEQRSSRKSHAYGYSIKRSGHASVVLVGFPSVGKSTVLNRLTNANSEVGAYAFTTLKPIPGVMKFNDANIQIIDVPGIIHGAASGKGRGKEVISIMRNSDLLLIILDVFHLEHYEALIKEVWDANIRANRKKPKVVVSKHSKGGLSINSTVPLSINKDDLKNIAKELGIVNADITVYNDLDIDDFIDSLEGNRVYLNATVIINKFDQYNQLSDSQKKKVDEFISKHKCLTISAKDSVNITELKQHIYDSLDLIRIYTKDKNKGVDLSDPIVLKKGVTIKDVGRHLHHEFITKFKFVKVWGKSAKFDGQIFRNLDHVVADKDVIEFFLK